MNSQQELLDAISTLNKNKDRSYDTPATVLRVDGDTVWVHIDGGADETPVARTINCEQGETVQVRISNGSAFLVGNASAPPTDDKRANAAHFIAQEAAVEATAANVTAVAARDVAVQAQAAVAQSLTTYETWYILSATEPTQPTEDSHSGWSTTEPAWSSSSTENLYYSIRTEKGDGTITWGAVGQVQSYADLVILKNAIISTVQTDYVGKGTSGISSLSSTMYQNANGVNIYNGSLAVGDSYAHIDGNSFDIKQATTAGTIDDTNDTVLASFGSETKIGDPNEYYVNIGASGIDFNDGNDNIAGINSYGFSAGLASLNSTQINQNSVRVSDKRNNLDQYVDISDDEIFISKLLDAQQHLYRQVTIDSDGMTGGGVFYSDGTSMVPTTLVSSTISASATSYTFEGDRIKTDRTYDLYDSIFGFTPTNMTVSTGRCVVTFPAQASTHKLKLFIHGWNKED